MRGAERCLSLPGTGRGVEAERRPGGSGRVSQFPTPPVHRRAAPTRSLRDLPSPEGEGEAVVQVARTWLGTPYRHQASERGVGADCLGLVRGVWCEVVGTEPEEPPPYSADWAEVGAEETLLRAARRRLVERPVGMMRPGDVLLFRMSEGAAVKHCAILSDVEGPEPRMIHAYWGRAVVESWMGPWWKRRLVAVFGWPAAPRA